MGTKYVAVYPENGENRVEIQFRGLSRGESRRGDLLCGNQSLRAASSRARLMRFDGVSSTRVEGRPRDSASVQLIGTVHRVNSLSG